MPAADRGSSRIMTEKRPILPGQSFRANPSGHAGFSPFLRGARISGKAGKFMACEGRSFAVRCFGGIRGQRALRAARGGGKRLRAHLPFGSRNPTPNAAPCAKADRSRSAALQRPEGTLLVEDGATCPRSSASLGSRICSIGNARMAGRRPWRSGLRCLRRIHTYEQG